MTPLLYCSSPSAGSRVSRSARRFSSVQGPPTDSNRFWHVLELSSAARMPFPVATICFAVFFKSSTSILKLLQMLCFNKSHSTRVRGHHDRMRHDVVSGEEHPVGQWPRDYTRRSEADVIALGEVARPENGREIGDSRVVESFDMFLVLRLPSAQKLAAETAHRSGCQNCFRTSTRTHQNIDARTRKARAERHRDIAVGKEADARTRSTRLFDELVVARTVECCDDNLGDFLAECFFHLFDVVGNGRVDGNIHDGLFAHA